MVESPSAPKNDRSLSTEERIELIRILNGLPLSQLLDLEFALDLPGGVMPAPGEPKGLRNRALLQWVEGPSGVGWEKFLAVLKALTGITLTCRSRRLELTIEGDISETDAGLLLRMLEEFQEKADAPSLKISTTRSGSIKMTLQGAWDELERLQQLIDSDELTEIVGQSVISAVSFLDLSRADLSGADLSGADLSGADLSGADLTSTILVGADLSNTNLARADLNAACLTKAVLLNAYLDQAYLTGANLIEADFSRSWVVGANIIDANLSRANLSGADLSGADLRQANLSRANLIEADLSCADLRDANLSGAYLGLTKLVGADLRRANVSQAEFAANEGLQEVEKEDLIARGANFQDFPGSNIPAYF